MMSRNSGGRIIAFPRRPATYEAMPTTGFARMAKVIELPIAHYGRRAAGVGRRALGKPSEQVDRDIQERAAEHLYEVLGELKGCAAKLGQLLSLYSMVLGPDYAPPYQTALCRLQDAAPAMGRELVHAQLRASLGTEWRSRFRTFDEDRPLPASLGQVHRATWGDGREVAVKIQYPGVRESVATDLRQLERLSLLAQGISAGADLPAIAAELGALLALELDYAMEARHQRVFAGGYAGDLDFVVPAVVHQAGDVLISEWIEGTPLSAIIFDGDQAERDRVGKQVLRFVASGPGRCGLQYADPHPGNFLRLDDGRLGVVDFGACYEISSGTVGSLTELLAALVSGDPATVAACARDLGFVRDGRAVDTDVLARSVFRYRDMLSGNLFRFTTEWFRTEFRRNTRLRLDNAYLQVTLPVELVATCRALIEVVGLLGLLEAEVSLRDELARWMADPIAE